MCSTHRFSLSQTTHQCVQFSLVDVLCWHFQYSDISTATEAALLQSHTMASQNFSVGIPTSLLSAWPSPLSMTPSTLHLFYLPNHCYIGTTTSPNSVASLRCKPGPFGPQLCQVLGTHLGETLSSLLLNFNLDPIFGAYQRWGFPLKTLSFCTSVV